MPPDFPSHAALISAADSKSSVGLNVCRIGVVAIVVTIVIITSIAKSDSNGATSFLLTGERYGDFLLPDWHHILEFDQTLASSRARRDARNNLAA